jgi:hypothetical protein
MAPLRFATLRLHFVSKNPESALMPNKILLMSAHKTVHNNTMANASNSSKHAAITLIEALLGVHQTHVITPSPPNASLVSSNGKNLEAQPIRHREVQIVKATDPVKKLGAAAGLAEEKNICTVSSFASPKAFGIRAKSGTYNLDPKPSFPCVPD